MKNLKAGYMSRKLPLIVLLLLSLSLNAACNLPSEGEANRTAYEEISQWNLFRGEKEILSSIPSDDYLALLDHSSCARIREPRNGQIFIADNTEIAVPICVSSDSQKDLIYVEDETKRKLGPAPRPFVHNWPFGIGVHTITANVVGGCPSLPVTFIVNPPEPSVGITSPANGQLFSAPTDIVISANIKGDHDIESVEFFANNQLLGTITGEQTSYILNWENVNPGVYRLTVQVTDEAQHIAISDYVLVVVVPEKPLGKADLGLTMSSSPNPAIIGGNLNYVLTVTNFGPSRATNIALTDFLPAGLDCYSSVATHGTYDKYAGEWNIGGLDPNRSARLTISTRVPASMYPGRIYYEATVAGVQRDDRTSNNIARINTLLIRRISSLRL